MTVAIAHRGDPVGHRENTLQAFAGAVALGADMVELDCKLTRDGRVVVLHDDTLDRLWGWDVPVRELDWPELGEVRSEHYRVPELAEVLRAVDVPVMVDVERPEVMEAALAVVVAEDCLERAVFAGGTQALVHLRGLSSTARVALTWDRLAPPSSDLLAAVRPEWFNPYFLLATPAVVRAHHEAGRGVSVWTVDDEEDIAVMLRAGVDAVISNQVARLVGMASAESGTPPEPGGLR